MQINTDKDSFLSDLEEFVNASAMLCESWMKLDNDFQEIINDKTEYPIGQSFDELVAELYSWRDRVVKEFEKFQYEFIVKEIVKIIKKEEYSDGECIDEIVLTLKNNGIEVFKGM